MLVSSLARDRLRRETRRLAPLAVALGMAATGAAHGQPSTEELKGLFAPQAADPQPATATGAADPRCQDPDQMETLPACAQKTDPITQQGFSLFSGGSAPKGPSAGVRTPRAHVGIARLRAPGADCAFNDAVGGGNLCVTFGLASSDLTEKSRAGLDRLAAVMLKDYPNSRLSIEGFTDSTGDADKNRQLSDARAHAVVDYLIAKGVPSSRLEAKGLGATAFLPGLPTSHAANRRVEARPLS